jgi:hypothetical protein
MHVGCLGRPPRRPRWTVRRTRWRKLITATEIAAAVAGILVASNIGIDRLRSPVGDRTNRASESVAIVLPPAATISPALLALPIAAVSSAANTATSSGANTATSSSANTATSSGANAGASDYPRAAAIVTPAAARLIAPSKPRRVPARLRATAERRRPAVATQGTGNGSVRTDAAGARPCGLHRQLRDSGCRQEGAHRASGVILPPS